MIAPPKPLQVYRVSPGLTSKPWVFFAGGIGLLVVALGGFVLALLTRTNPLSLHLTTTLPTIIAVGLFMTGYRFARSPREVAFSQEGLRVCFGKSDKLLSWNEIAWGDVQTQAITNRKLMAMYGTDGKVLLKLPSNLEGFDALVAAIKQHLSDHPSPHASAVRWRKSRRTATALLVGAVIALAGATWTAWMAYDTQRAEQLMRTRGVDGEGIVIRKFIAPDGRTHRIEYRVAGAGEAAELHNVEIDNALWAILDTGAHVPVRTVPGHPEIAQLQVGEIEDEFLNPSPKLNVLLSVGLFLMAVLFLVGAILGFKGIDIATDPTTGKLKIDRLPK